MRAQSGLVYFIAIFLLVLLSCAASAAELQENALPAVGYIGIWADAIHSDCDVFPAQYTQFDAWIWCLPSVNGLQAAEFAVRFPATVVTLSTVLNPEITVRLGLLPDGMSVAFGTCQTDWVWTHHLACMSLAAPGTPDYIGIIPHPGTLPVPAFQFANCECGYPIEPCNRYANLFINQACDPAPPQLPDLTGVNIVSATEIRAVYDMCMSTSNWSPGFVIYERTYPYNSIRTIQAMLVAENEYDLTLERPMSDSTTYGLSTYGYVMSCEGYYNRSQWEFTFFEATATLLQSCSASFAGTGVEISWELSEVDAGVEFFVSRSEGGSDFLPLDMSGLVRDGLDFTYMDSRVEPGERYVYKVEYAIDGASRLLFISEEIRTPAALLALDQNRPNPFNPSTTISFTLPIECAVRLEVYDVSGRLVARLIDGERRGAGPHNVEWNGRDASGRAAASGIYVYRLTAGGETISRKMVLLR